MRSCTPPLNADQVSTDLAEQANEPASANDQKFETAYLPVRTLVLETGARRVQRTGERQKPDELWKGEGFDPLNLGAESVPMYLRIGEGEALVAELLCGCLARVMQLPAPEVFLVFVLPGRLRKSKILPRDKVGLYVGTRDIGGRSFAQMVSDDAAAAFPLLLNWSELGTVAAFDEWLANSDRNPGNLIYVDQSLHIIDHAEAFGGSIRKDCSLTKLINIQFNNLLGEMIQSFRPDRVHDLLEKSHLWLSNTASKVDVAATIKQAGIQHWTTPENRDELINFITARLSITHALLCKRLGHPQLTLSA